MGAFFGLLEEVGELALGLCQVGKKTGHLRLDGGFGSGQGSPAHRLNELVGRGDQLGFLTTDECVAARRGIVHRATGEGEEFAVVVAGHPGGDETAAAVFGFGHDNGIGQAGYNTVALDEIAGKGFRTGRKFGEQPTLFQRGNRIVAMLVGVDPVEAVGRDDDSGDTVFYRCAVGGDIDAVGAAADDGERVELSRQITHEGIGQFFAPLGRPARADDGNDMPLGRADVAFAIEDDRPVGALAQAVGVVGIGRCPDTDTVGRDPFEFALSPSHGIGHARFVQMTPRLFGRTEAVEERQVAAETVAQQEREGDIVERRVDS